MVSLSVRIDPQLEIDSSLSDILDTSFSQVGALMPICLFVFFPPMRSYQKMNTSSLNVSQTCVFPY